MINSIKTLNIIHAKIPGLDKAAIFYKPITGSGVDGSPNVNNYALFKLYGIPFSDNSPVEICNVKLKDYATTGFFASGSDYRNINIPSGNSSGKITMVIGEISEVDKYELFFYIVCDQEHLIDFIDVQLIRDSFSTLKKGNTS